MKSDLEKNGGTYRRVNGYYISNFTLPREKEIVKHGRFYHIK